MGKVVLNNIVSGYASSTAYNVNNALIETALENTLSRDGTTPNQMEADFDLNGNDILNGGTINAADIVIAGSSLTASTTAAAASAASALASKNAAAISETNSAASAVTAATYASNIVNWDFKGAWLTATAYVVDNIVTEAGSSYICVVSHTSGTFATDLTAVKWVLFASKGAAGAGTGDLLAANNLSELAGTAATARSNIGAAASASPTISGTATFTGATAFTGTATFSGLVNEAQGSNIASASTINLTTATGNYVHITGTTTITAVTLAQGAERTVVFDDILTFTHSASLILPSGASITTAAGDVAKLRGEAAGVVRCVSYTKASGAAVVVSTSTDTNIQGGFKNLVLSATGTSAAIAVSYDELILGDGAGVYVAERSVSGSITTTNTGANGLDTGALASSTWYSIWRVGKADGTRAWLLSLSATAPTMPSGYIYKARIGWFRTDGTANKYPLSFIQAGRNINYKVASGSNVTAYPTLASGNQGNVTTPTWVAVGVSSFVPSTAIAISVTASGSGATVRTMIAPNNSFGSKDTTTNPAPFVMDEGASGPAGYIVSFLLESTNIYVAQQYSMAGQSMCVGWEDNI